MRRACSAPIIASPFRLGARRRRRQVRRHPALVTRSARARGFGRRRRDAHATPDPRVGAGLRAALGPRPRLRSGAACRWRCLRRERAFKVEPRRRLQRGYPHMAIHPYPVALIGDVVLRDGTLLHVRPIRPEGAELEQAFVGGLSEQSRYNRFFYRLAELSPVMLARFTQVDYDRVRKAPGPRTSTGNSPARKRADAGLRASPGIRRRGRSRGRRADPRDTRARVSGAHCAAAPRRCDIGRPVRPRQ